MSAPELVTGGPRRTVPAGPARPALPVLTVERVGVGAALACLAWLLAGLPLLLAGALRPLPMLLLFAGAAGLLFAVARPVLGAGAGGAPEPRWPYLAVAGIAIAFAAGNGLLHAEHLVLRRDPGSYAQIALWLAAHGDLPVPVHIEAFGGADPALDPSSPAFYPAGASAVQPQFMSGWPLLLVAAGWLAGPTGVLLLPVVVGGLSLLVAGALAARLIGPRWAPLAVLLLAVAQPVWHAARSTYSEPLTQLLVLSALLLLVRALDEGSAPAAGLAGLLLGTATLVRVDVLREVTLLVPVVGAMFLARRREAVPLAAGLGTGVAFGMANGVLVARAYLRDIAGSLLPLLVLLAGTLALTAAVVVLLRGRALRPVPPAAARVAAWVAATATLLGFGLLVVRPWLHRQRGQPPAGAETIRRLQLEQGLPVDGQRTYGEQALHWLAWWVGWPLLVVAAVGAALLLARTLRSGERPAWSAVLVVLLGSTAMALWRPGITPDHPWADRRFVVVVLPAVALLSTWAAARARDWLAARSRAAAGIGTAVLVVLLVAPGVAASAPLYGHRTEAGQLTAIERVCRAVPGDAAVLLVDLRAAREWPPALRTQCGVPAAGVTDSRPATLARLAARARAAGRTPVLFAAEPPQPIVAAGLSPQRVVDLATTEDARLLARRPTRVVPLRVVVWLGLPR